MGIREDIRNHFDDSDFLDINFRYGSFNVINGRGVYQMLADTRYTFVSDPSTPIHYDRGRRRMHLRFSGNVPLSYKWSLVAHESIHAYVQHRGYGIGHRIMDDEVVAHLGQTIYFKNMTGNYDFGFMREAEPIFTEAARIMRQRSLQQGHGQPVGADDVRTLKRLLHDLAGYPL